MTPTAPDWLTRHDGTLKTGADASICYVYFDHKPHYRLELVPAQGKDSCHVRQTENGKVLASTAAFDTPEAALQAGLNDLGKYLGWL